MASPVDAGRITTNSAAADPIIVNLPASIAAGDLLIVFGRVGGAVNFNLPAGWTWLLQNDNTDGTGQRSSIIYRLADGSEGATLSWDMASAGGVVVTVAYRITGAANPASQAPQISALSVVFAANANPPALSPSGGSKDYLFVAACGYDGGAAPVTAAPASYSNLQAVATGGANFLNASIGTATRQATTATEDPGAFTSGAPINAGTTFTLAVYPPVAVTGGGRGRRVRVRP